MHENYELSLNKKWCQIFQTHSIIDENAKWLYVVRVDHCPKCKCSVNKECDIGDVLCCAQCGTEIKTNFLLRHSLINVLKLNADNAAKITMIAIYTMIAFLGVTLIPAAIFGNLIT